MTEIKIKETVVKCKTHQQWNDDYEQYTETEFWYDDYSSVSVIDFKNGESIIMTAVNCYHDINGSSHDLHFGTYEEVAKKFDYLPKSDSYAGDMSIGSSFKITKINSFKVSVEKL